MRNFIFTLAITISCFNSTFAQFKLGVQGGTELSRTFLVFKEYNARSKSKFKPFFTAAINGDIQLARHLHTQFGLRYSRIDVPVSNIQNLYFDKAYCHVLQLPASIVYNVGHKGGNHLGIAAGAYGAWNIKGRKYIYGSDKFVRLKYRLQCR